MTQLFKALFLSGVLSGAMETRVLHLSKGTFSIKAHVPCSKSLGGYQSKGGLNTIKRY